MWIGLGVSLIVMTAVWVLSVRMQRASIIDAFWGPGFVVVATACLLSRGDVPWNREQVLLWTMVCLWGLRLGWHLSIRCFGDVEEDRRYAAMRRRHDPGFWWKSLLIVFWLQAVILWFVALPVQLALLGNQAPISVAITIAAVVLWGTGLFFEAVGDAQLRQFRENPENAGAVLNRGLWAWTRHPNYFGDFLVWWGLWLMSLNLGAPIWTVLCPAVMSAFLMKYSGVGLLEKDISERRPAYAEYVRTTNAFFPGPRRS